MVSWIKVNKMSECILSGRIGPKGDTGDTKVTAYVDYYGAITIPSGYMTFVIYGSTYGGYFQPMSINSIYVYIGPVTVSSSYNLPFSAIVAKC